MKERTSLMIIFVLAVAGMLFSGYLSYTELSSGACALGSCTNSIYNIPVCIYGLAIYTLIFIFSLLGLLSKN